MGFFRNAVHAVIVTAMYLALAVFLGLIGIDLFLPTTFSTIGIFVGVLLAFMEVTYNRF